MLNKIANIESAKGFKSTNGRASKAAYEKFIHTYNSEDKTNFDSVQFSPATLFLSSVNWDEVEFHQNSTNEIKLNFTIDEIKFEIEINFMDFYKTSHQRVKMKRKVVKFGSNRIQEVIISVLKPKIKIFDKYPKFDIPGIKKSFAKISELNMEGTFTEKDTLSLSAIKEGQEDIIYNDFINIFNVVYSFIAKLGKYGLTKSTVFPLTKNERLIIEKISVKNV